MPFSHIKGKVLQKTDLDKTRSKWGHIRHPSGSVTAAQAIILTAPGRAGALPLAHIHPVGENTGKCRDAQIWLCPISPHQISAKAAFFHLPPWTPNKDQQLEAPHHCQAQHPRTCHLCSSLPFVLICCVFALIARLGQATVALCRTWRREVLQLGCCQRTDVTGWVTARC